MSDPSAFGFGKFVPGFDFLQSLSKSAAQPASHGAAIPGMSSWVAPTLSVEELDKRIQELKAVQFWLEQNGTALKATIQALEVQKMTLTTLQGMNVNMAELAKAFTARAPDATVTTTPAQPARQPEVQPAAEPAPQAAPKTQRTSKRQAEPSATAATVDPMQWWGSLTQQFQNIASAAMQDAAAQALKTQNSAAQTAPSNDKNKPVVKAARGTVARKKPAAKKAPASRA